MEGSILQNLKKWFNKFERYKVTYKNGSYHLANLFQSPQTVVESFDKMPFCKHDRDKQCIKADSIFLKCHMHYFELEDGFWLMPSHIHFKKNVLMKNLYDKDLPLEYHFINIHIKTNTVKEKSTINGLILKNRAWSMFKAGQALTEYHFKNSEEKNITLYFTSKWLNNYLKTNSGNNSDSLANFFTSSNNYLIIDEDDTTYETIFDEIMLYASKNTKDKYIDEIKSSALVVINNFRNKLNTEIIAENHFSLTDKDRKNIQRAEDFLLKNIVESFPGIDEIAKEVGISSSKLKTDFKNFHNKSIYQYYSEQQMQLAREMLVTKKYTIKEIATKFGYENSSKFSARFKTIYNVLPSEIEAHKILDKTRELT